MPTPTTRTFLGWDAPLLPRAAAHLVDRYASDGVADLRPATLVLPGGRARRRVVEILLDEAEARDLTLIPPRSTTVGGLPDLLRTGARPEADAATARRAWSRALRGVEADALRRVFPRLPASDDLAEWDRMAELLAGLHESVAAGGHRFSDVARMCSSELSFDDGPRWRVLARIQERYVRLLDEAGLADRLEERLAALESGSVSYEGDVWLVSIADLPSVTRRLLEASGARVHALIHAPAELDRGPDEEGAAFDALGLPSTEYWQEARVPVTDDVLRVVERPADQADAAIDFLHGLGGRYSAADVVAAVHPDADVVPFLEQRLEARGVSPRYAAGTPLPHTAPLRLLEAVADYVDDRGYLALAALLRHPDAGALIDATAGMPGRLEAIDAADRYFNDHLPYRLQGTLPHGVREGARLPPVVRALERSGPLGRLEGRKRLSEWMPLVRDVLLVAYGDRTWGRSDPRDRHLLDTLARVRRAASALAELPDRLDETCAASAAIRSLLLELRDEALPPDARRDALELLDWLEVPLDDAPVVMLTGFNEGFLPESVQGHAFLPDALRARLGLMDNRRRVARDAYRLTTVLRSKPEVRLIAGRRTSQGDPLRPSRLAFRVPEEELADRVLAFFRGADADHARPSLASLGLAPATRSAFTVPPEPDLELSEREVPPGLSVTAFKAILDDPYRWVLEKIYRLDAIDDEAREMDALVFGSLVHDVLQGFGQLASASPPTVDVTDADAVRETLHGVLREIASERFTDATLPAVALQLEQIEARLAAFAERQATWARQGWRIVASERQPEGDGVAFEVDGEPVLLRGRIDRIDHNPETGRWAVLDYKTGASVAEPDRAHRKRRAGGKEWIDLQLPLYRRLLTGVVDDAGAPVVGADALREGRIDLGYVALPKDADGSGFLLASWSGEELAEAEEVARDVVRLLRGRHFRFDPAVTKPRSYGRDPLEPLLTRGWQAAEADESGSPSEQDGGDGGGR